MTSVHLSAIDEERFGIRTARALHVTLDSLSQIIAFCRSNHVAFLIARCLVDDLGAAQAMEREGFLLMDTLIYYGFDLSRLSVPPAGDVIRVRSFDAGEEEAVRAVAVAAFHGYFGHYHADPRLDRRQCDEVYVSWAYRSCVSREVADEVLVADCEDGLLGFITLKAKSTEEAEGGLLGVVSTARGTGVAQALMTHALQWCQGKGLRRMLISTQITNLASQKLWVRLGFEPSHAYYTFHKWFD